MQFVFTVWLFCFELWWTVFQVPTCFSGMCGRDYVYLCGDDGPNFKGLDGISTGLQQSAACQVAVTVLIMGIVMKYSTVMPPYPLIQYPRFQSSAAQKNLKIKRNKQFISFKTPAKRERATAWWNPAAQMSPVLDLSSFAPVLTLPPITCLPSASSVLAVRISCRVIAVFVFRKPLFIN
jgi:hypothetical protein